jgi:hypothetical protein
MKIIPGLFKDSVAEKAGCVRGIRFLRLKNG